MSTCVFAECNAHPEAPQRVGKFNWEKRPLPCRLGIHGHYTAYGTFGRRNYTCLCCGFEWKDSDINESITL